MQVLFNILFYFCGMTQTRASTVLWQSLTEIRTHARTREQLLHFSCVDIYHSRGWTLWRVTRRCFSPGRPLCSLGRVRGVGGAHVNITAAQSAILNVWEPIRDWLGCLAFPWHHGVSTAVLILPQRQQLWYFTRLASAEGFPTHHPSWP